MFEKVVTWLKRVKPKDEPVETEMKELAELVEHGDPSDPRTLERMAKLLGQTD